MTTNDANYTNLVATKSSDLTEYSDCAAGDMITRLTHIQKEIEDLVEDVEILSDENLMRCIEESEKDFEKGRYYTLKTDEDIDEFFRDLEKE